MERITLLSSSTESINKRKMTKLGGGIAAGTSITALLVLTLLATGATVEAHYASRGGFHVKGAAYERRKPRSRILAGKGIGDTTGTAGGGKGGTGKGGHGSTSGGSGSSIPSEAWVDGEYYGCLGLSEEQQANLTSTGHRCDYVIHDNDSTSRKGTSGGTSGNSDTSAAAGDTGDGNSDNAKAENEAGGGDGYTLSYNYPDDGDGADDSNGQSSANDQSGSYQTYASGQSGNNQAAANDQSGNSQADNNTNGEKKNTNKWYTWKQNNKKTTTGGNSAVAQNSDGNPVVSTITEDYENPYTAFNIEFCDTYENLWTWDLAISCGKTTDYSDCHCTFAEVLMEKGQLTCDAYHNCPSGCSICSNCLKLLGCDDETTTSFAGSISHNGSAVVAAVAIISLLVGSGCCMIVGQRNRRRGKLNDHLMDDETVDVRGKVWMVPVNLGVPHENGTSMRPVWLAPDRDSVSAETSSASFSTSSSHSHLVERQVIDLTGVTSYGEEKRYTTPGFPRNLFPDVLAPSVPAERGLPPRGVLAALTDMTGQSEPSSSHDEGDAHRLKNHAPRYNRQPPPEVHAVSESEEFEHGSSYATASSSSSYYSSQREVLDLPSLTGPPPRVRSRNPTVHYEPPVSRNS